MRVRILNWDSGSSPQLGAEAGRAGGVNNCRLETFWRNDRRLNDFDGCGHLSERRLSECCEFLSQTALDQLDFVPGLLDLDKLRDRIVGDAGRRESAKELAAGSGLVLREILLRGQIARGEVARILNISPRTAQTVTGKLLTEGLLRSDSPKAHSRHFRCPSVHVEASKRAQSGDTLQASSHCTPDSLAS